MYASHMGQVLWVQILYGVLVGIAYIFISLRVVYSPLIGKRIEKLYYESIVSK